MSFFVLRAGKGLMEFPVSIYPWNKLWPYFDENKKYHYSTNWTGILSILISTTGCWNNFSSMFN